MQRLKRDYFERLYEADPDPWNFETSAYEHEKYNRTLHAIEGRPSRALEIGCSIGVFTGRLATRCDHVVAVDMSAAAIESARRRLVSHPNVVIERRTLPENMPLGSFDLVVASEVLYYWSESLLRANLGRIENAVAPGGVFVAVHWTHPTCYPLQGERVHHILGEELALTPTLSVALQDYRLDRYERSL